LAVGHTKSPSGTCRFAPMALRSTVEARCGSWPFGPRQRRLSEPTKPPDLVEADEGAAECGEGEVGVRAAFVVHRQAAETAVVEGLFGEQLIVPAAATGKADWRGSAEGRGAHAVIVTVGPAQANATRGATGVRDQRLAANGRVRASLRPSPPFAGTLALSSVERRQLICPAPCNRSSRAKCSAARPSASASGCKQQLDRRSATVGNQEMGHARLSASAPVSLGALLRSVSCWRSAGGAPIGSAIGVVGAMQLYPTPSPGLSPNPALRISGIPSARNSGISVTPMAGSSD